MVGPVKKYTVEHEWISVDSKGIGAVGLTDYAQKALGDVVFVEVPQVGSKIDRRCKLRTGCIH